MDEYAIKAHLRDLRRQFPSLPMLRDFQVIFSNFQSQWQIILRWTFWSLAQGFDLCWKYAAALEVCLYQIYPPSIDTLVTGMAEDNDDCACFDEDSLCCDNDDAQHLWCEPSDKWWKGCIASLGDEFTSYKNHLQAEIRSYKNHLEFKQKLEATKTTFKLKLI